MQNHNHKLVRCKCGNIETCCDLAKKKLLDLSKPHNLPEELIDFCLKCSYHIAAVIETEKQQYDRVASQLSHQVRLLEQQNKGDKQVVGLAVFGWLITARMEIENLKKRLKEAQHR